MTLNNFKKKRDDSYQKACEECNEKERKYRRGIKCQHGRKKSTCKECGGSSICEHDRERCTCKECGGGSICEHEKRRSQCKQCGGGSICEHEKRRSRCKQCGGGSICEHGREKSKCKECGGAQICEHGREKSACKECDGAQICEHNKVRSRCKDCDGGSICEHGRIRSTCKVCNPAGHLKNIVSRRIHHALKSDKELRSLEYIGCDIETLRTHLENQFTEGMTWENQGLWHIDHIIPVAYDNPTSEQKIERLHYTNLQPLWAVDNISKGNRFIG